MTISLNIYCDESTHLPRDGMPFMVLGAVTCPTDSSAQTFRRISEIRAKHGLSQDFEVKWSKASPGKLEFYMDLVDYFFDNDDLAFRAVVAPKGPLQHERFGQTHDDWYYKMMFYLVRNVLPSTAPAYIYLDKKDTRSGEKVRKLHEVVANASYDFDRKKIRRVQIVESHHVALIQLADLLIGAVNYANRGLALSEAKGQLVARVRERSGGKSLVRSTLLSEHKFNVFVWQPRDVAE